MSTKSRAKLTMELDLLQKQVYTLRRGHQGMTLLIADIMSRLSAGLGAYEDGDYIDGKIFPIFASVFDKIRIYLDTSESEVIFNTTDGVPFYEVGLDADLIDRIPPHA